MYRFIVCPSGDPAHTYLYLRGHQSQWATARPAGTAPKSPHLPLLSPNSPSGRCHHVEASAATTDFPAPAAAPHATGRGPPACRGHQPSQRRPPGAPSLRLGSPRASRGRFPLPGACSRCRERTPSGTRGHLGTAAAAAAAAAASGEARASGYRRHQVRRGGVHSTKT